MGQLLHGSARTTEGDLWGACRAIQDSQESLGVLAKRHGIKYAFHHIFDRVCDEHDIEYRLTIIKCRD